MKIALTELELLSFAEEHLQHKGTMVETDCDDNGVDLFVIRHEEQHTSTLNMTEIYPLLTAVYNLPSAVQSHDVSEIDYAGTTEELFVFSD